MGSNFKLVSATGTEASVIPSGSTYGYLKTQGNELVDTVTGETVRLVGANWFGAEGTTRVPNGLWARNYKEMMDDMVDAGINSLRVPISPEILLDKVVTDGIRSDLNPDLVGLTPLEVMDKIVAYAGEIGIRIVLDMHRIDAGTGKQESGLWFSDSYSFNDLRSDWKEIVTHYKNDPTVVGVDLFNEPSGKAHWAEGGPAKFDWAAAATTLGNDVLSINSNLLVFIEGNHTYNNKWYWVGGNLKGVTNDPITLNVDDRVVYSPHDYPYSVQSVPWLKGATKAEILDNFKTHWGYIHEDGIAPIAIGEIGAKLLNNTGDVKYLDTLFNYLESEIAQSTGGTGGPSLFWWGWNPNSGDTGGLLKNDWNTLDTNKTAYFDRVSTDLLPTTQAAVLNAELPKLTFNIEMNANVGTDRVYYYKVKSGTATENVDFVARDGVLRFKPGQTTNSVDVTILPDTKSEGDETVILDLYYVDGRKITSFQGTIQNTDIANGNVGSNTDQLVSPGDTTQETVVPAAPAPTPDSTPVPAATPAVVIQSADSETSAKMTEYFSTHKVEVTASPVDDDTYGFTAVLSRYDGKSVGDWKLLLDPVDSADLNLIPAGNNGNYNVNYRADGAAKFSPIYWTDKNASSVTVKFKVDVEGASTQNVSSAALDWDASRFNQGAGVSKMDGTQTDTGSWLDVDFHVTKTWGVEFYAKITITNTGTQALKNWTISLDGKGFNIDEIHNAVSWVGGDGEMRVMGPEWNKVLSAGESITFGLDGVSDKPLVTNAPSAATHDAATVIDQVDILML